MEEMKSRVFIWVNDDNFITRIEGEYSLPDDLSDAILIEEGYGDKYSLGQTHFLEKPIINDNGEYNYKYVDGEIVEV